MKSNMEQYQVVYSVLKTHIQFGVYGFGDILPSIKDATAGFFVSVDTMCAAYQQLQRNSLVTISTNIGTTIVRNYRKEETEQNIQILYAQKRSILIDLSKSLRLLLGYVQWTGFKSIPTEIYDNPRQLEDSHSLPQTTTFEHVVRAYTALGNNLLFRLVWQISMPCENPFFNVRDSPWRTFAVKDFLPRSWDCCIKQDWDCLRELVYASQDGLSLALCQFYDKEITMPPPEQEAAFQWNSYNKASQICYSLVIDLLVSISNGVYPANTLLPSLNKLSQEKQASVSTVRRALSLLNGVGATKSAKWIGTRVLSSHKIIKNCDLKSPTVRRRLLDMAQSLQFLALSCRDMVEGTIQVLTEDGLQACRKRLAALRNSQQYELIDYATLEPLKCFAPYKAIRTVRKELLQLLFWGYSLKDIWETDEGRIRYYLSCFEELDLFLAERDAAGFSVKLEGLMAGEFHFTIEIMISQGIHEAKKLLVIGI